MRGLFVLLTFIPFAVLARQSHNGARFHHSRQTVRDVRRAKVYNLVDKYQGTNFFENWDFFAGADPTNGKVNYLNRQDALSSGLASIQNDNTAVIAVDDKNRVPVGGNRNSVRISSKKTYDFGLFIADFKTMPYGCGVWPSWWSVGPNWPDAGEIDIIEGVNNQATNQYTLHSSPTGKACVLDRNASSPNNKTYTSNVISTKCASTAGDNAGCGFSDTDPRSFGQGFNKSGGGIFAHLWDKANIKMWHFARNEIPLDIIAGRPDPSLWPIPQAVWSSDTCDIESDFYEHTLTLDTTLCGDWADGTYANSGCAGTCAEAVANPENFVYAKWKINYIAVYQ